MNGYNLKHVHTVYQSAARQSMLYFPGTQC